jgi:hypothetical protein
MPLRNREPCADRGPARPCPIELMDERFRAFTDSLKPRFEALIAMPPARLGSLPRDIPKGGVYLFSEGSRHLYVGRTKRLISKRLCGHVSTAEDCPLAFRLAREATGATQARYSGEHTRGNLLLRADFRREYDAAKQRIKQMDIRWVHEPDPTRQALLEIYVAVVLQTPYNDFDPH